MLCDKSIRRVAAIDIGSNSVRLAIYAATGSAVIPLYDEKATCALGRDLRETGRLNPDGWEAALKELGRFTQIAAATDLEGLYPFATAAVRDATDGKDFVASVKTETGLDVEILPGLDEARFSAMGVAGAIPGATGIVGDLGGGSLELVQLDDGGIVEQATLPLGALMRPDKWSIAQVSKWLDEELSSIGWLQNGKGNNLYLVGGAWRAFAKAHMAHTGYPLSIIHDYRITADSAIEVADLISVMGDRSATLLSSVSRRRRPIIPYAALALSRITASAKPNWVVASSYGLREGVVRHRLGVSEGTGDPLLDYCRFAGQANARIPPDGESIRAWLAPLVAGWSREELRWLQAACWMADIAGRDHPDRRAYIALARGLNIPAVAITHTGRAFLGATLQARYGGLKLNRPDGILQQLLSPETLEKAYRLGTALRLAHAISPSGAGLAAAPLTLLPETLELRGPAVLLGGETLGRRLERLANAYGRAPVRCQRRPAAA